MSGFPINSSTLFLGDLSVNCNEESIYQLFSSYGEIEIIQLKRSDRDLQRVHLGYGFIKFTTTEAAERALQALNGYFFLGRSIRVGWAEDHDSRTNRRLKGSPRQPNISDLRSADPKKNRQTAQIHVIFSSSDMSQRISELELGDIFSQFGNLVDIAIKKNVVSPDQRTQSGYGFIHFALSEEGIRSAVTAVERTNHQTCDRISFQSKVTHSLQAHIFALKHRTSQQPPPTSSYEPRQSPVPAFLPSTTTMRYDSSSLRFDSYQNRQRPPQSSYLSSYSEGPPTADRKHSFTESPFETYQSQLDSSYSSSNVNENSWKNDR